MPEVTQQLNDARGDQGQVSRLHTQGSFQDTHGLLCSLPGAGKLFL